MCCDILMILLYICVTWSWRIYDCSIYVLYKSGVTVRAVGLIPRIEELWSNLKRLISVMRIEGCSRLVRGKWSSLLVWTLCAHAWNQEGNHDWREFLNKNILFRNGGHVLTLFFSTCLAGQYGIASDGAGLALMVCVSKILCRLRVSLELLWKDYFLFSQVID
jgi:hypothetical protein